MITLLKMPALFLGMLAVFCCLGSFFIRENRYESGHLGETVLFGFIAYYFLFELISVPMMVLGAKLHLLAWVWAAVVAVLVIPSVFIWECGESGEKEAAVSGEERRRLFM